MKNLLLYLLFFYILIAILLGINPGSRFDWNLEMILPLLFLIFLISTYKKFKLSNLSYVLIFIFLMLHTLGAHYIYSEVPFGEWMKEFFNLQRNSYDRLVHFSFGLLLAYPIRELSFKLKWVSKKLWMPPFIILIIGILYELIELSTWFFITPEQNADFLGLQGDKFDYYKDVILAVIGAIIPMTVVYFSKKSK